MADALGTILSVIEVVNAAVDVFHKIHDCPDQMRLIGERMERLAARLTAVEAFLRRQTIDASGSGLELLAVVAHIRTDSRRVQGLFTKFRDDVGPFGWQFRFKLLTQVYFALGSNADEIKELADRIDRHRVDLREGLLFMGVVGIDDMHKIVVQQGQQPAAAAAAAAVAVGPPKHLPSPVARRSDFNILFVDPYNDARSVVAEGYTKLLREWTVRAGDEWPLKLIHSAGFFVRGGDGGGVDDVVQGGIRYLHPSYKLAMSDQGGRAPSRPALAALFDNGMFKGYGFKQDVRAQMEARRARGLARTMFKTYDYVAAFTDREYDNLIRLRAALVERDGAQAAVGGGGKGRVVHLGSYIRHHYKPGERPQEILVPKDVDDRAQWNVKVGQLKIAIKCFLKREMGWERPKKGAAVSA